MAYEYETLLKMAYSYLSKENKGKLNRQNSATMAATYMMLKYGVGIFDEIYRYEVNKFFTTGSRANALSAWKIKVAASHIAKFDKSDTSDYFYKDKTKLNKLTSSIINIKTPGYNLVMNNFNFNKTKELLSIYYDNMSKTLVLENKELFTNNNCFSLLPQISKHHPLAYLANNVSKEDVCNISKKIGEGEIPKYYWDEVARKQVSGYMRSGKINRELDDAYGFAMIFDMSYDVDLSKIFKH